MINNKTVLITGAARRIGKSIASDLAKNSWNIVIHYNNSDKEANELAEQIIKDGHVADVVKANLNDIDDVNNIFPIINNKMGKINALINCASLFEEDNAFSVNNDSFNNHININLRAPVILSKYFSEQVTEGEDNNIINIIDQRVLKLNPSHLSYTISKFGLWGATQTLAQAYSPLIRVNAIGPGPILMNKKQSKKDFDEEVLSTLLKKTPKLSDINDAIKFILNTTSVTGQMIAIDSGQHLAN